MAYERKHIRRYSNIISLIKVGIMASKIIVIVIRVEFCHATLLAAAKKSKGKQKYDQLFKVNLPGVLEYNYYDEDGKHPFEQACLKQVYH